MTYQFEPPLVRYELYRHCVLFSSFGPSGKSWKNESNLCEDHEQVGGARECVVLGSFAWFF